MVVARCASVVRDGQDRELPAEVFGTDLNEAWALVSQRR